MKSEELLSKQSFQYHLKDKVIQALEMPYLSFLHNLLREEQQDKTLIQNQTCKLFML